MADGYTTNQGWTQMARGDVNWDVVLNAIIGDVDALGAVGPLSVRTLEQPTSQSLYVAISAGTFEKSDGTLVTYGGNTGYAVTASATNYLYLTDAGVLTANTTGFPVGANVVTLAIVVAGASTITSIADARRVFSSFGQQSPLYAAASANTFFAGPTSGAAATATFRTMVDADLATTDAAIKTALCLFTGGFGVYRRVPGAYPYAVVAGDGWVEVDSSSARTINLPAASSFAAGECVTVLDGNGFAGTNAITISPHGTDTINGSTSAEVISSNFGWLELYSDGVSNWHALAPGSGGGGYGSVTSVSNADGTLTISPTSGNVIASLNTAHSNTWTVGQTIAPTSTSAIGLTINAPSGTTVPSFEVQLNGSNKLWVNSAGSVCVGSASLATTATDGFLYVPTCSGVPTGAATAETGLAALIVDSADGRLYGNIAGTWTNLTPSVGSLSVGATVVSGTTSGYILYDNGGVLGAEQFVPAAHGGTGLDGSAAANGAIPIGNGAGYSLATITAGSGITVTNSAGGITIAATAGGAVLTVGTTAVNSGTTGFILYDNAGVLGAEQFVPTAHGGTGLDASAAANGTLLIGNGGGVSLSTLTAGSGITITNGAGSITIAASGGSGASGWAVTTPGAYPYTILTTDTVILADCSGGAVTVTLPTAVGVSGKVYAIKDKTGNAHTHNITVATTSAQTIDLAPTATIAIRFETAWFISDGANWQRLSPELSAITGAVAITGALSDNRMGANHAAYNTSDALNANYGLAFIANTSRAAVTMTLPSAASFGAAALTIKDISGNAATHTITVSRSGSDTIDGGSTSLTITTNYGAIRLQCDGASNWYTV